MKLLIKIEEKTVRVVLKEGERAADEADFALDHNLSIKLLPAIDKLLKKNRLEPKDLEKAELETEIADSYTSFRIAKAVVDAINWAA